MDGPLTLVANPGSASRKYALYAGDSLRAELHFEWLNGEIVYGLSQGDGKTVFADIASLSEASSKIVTIFKSSGVLQSNETISNIGLRVAAPGTYFQQHRIVDNEFEENLNRVIGLAPTHVTAALEELANLKKQFKGIKIIGASDSAFHTSRPDYAKYYGIPKKDADSFDIKKFGYHGLSVASVVSKLKTAGKLPPKLVAVHLGGGASVSAVLNGRSIDNTMGYSPIEGLIMSTRSGSIDPTAVFALKQILKLDDAGMHDYLSNQSGLLGIGGSAEIPELIAREKAGDKQSLLALNTYIYNVQKGIAEMVSALGGIDALALTGTVCERSIEIRHHLMDRLHYLDFNLDELANEGYTKTPDPQIISKLTHSKPILIVPTDEAKEILNITRELNNT